MFHLIYDAYNHKFNTNYSYHQQIKHSFFSYYGTAQFLLIHKLLVALGLLITYNKQNKYNYPNILVTNPLYNLDKPSSLYTFCKTLNMPRQFTLDEPQSFIWPCICKRVFDKSIGQVPIMLKIDSFLRYYLNPMYNMNISGVQNLNTGTAKLT